MKKLLLLVSILILFSVTVIAYENQKPVEFNVKTWLGEAPDLNKNHLYLVEFWATWCPPCRVSIPHLNELAEKFKDKPVTFIGLSSEKPETIKKFMENQKFSYHIGIETGSMSKALKVKGIPDSFLLDANKNVLWSGHPMELNEEILSTYLKKINQTEPQEKKEILNYKIDEYLKETPSFKDKKLIVVEFWATWCPPCRTSIPHLNELANTFKEKSVIFIGVSNEDKNKVLDFMKKQNFDYYTAIAKGREMATQLKVKGIPFAVIVNNNFEILWKGHPMNINNNLIESLIK